MRKSGLAWSREASLSSPEWLDTGPTSGMDPADEMLPAIHVDDGPLVTAGRQSLRSVRQDFFNRRPGSALKHEIPQVKFGPCAVF